MREFFLALVTVGLPGELYALIKARRHLVELQSATRVRVRETGSLGSQRAAIDVEVAGAWQTVVSDVHRPNGDKVAEALAKKFGLAVADY